MLEQTVIPDATLAVILGASVYPKAELDTLIPAANSARDFERYLRSDEGLSLPSRNLISLFDSDESPNEIDNRISQFLKDRQKEARDEGLPIRDLIFYYVGHGGFTGRDQDYFLALRSTTKDREGPSSLRMVDLAGTLSNEARNLRRYLILDCCFSATAYAFFQQSDPVEAVRRKTLESIPRKGTALLCSSSASNVSLTPKSAKYTMFSGALLAILSQNARKELAFSLHEIGEQILEELKDKYESQAVRPKVISPDEREGDIACIPLFPNASQHTSPVEKRLAEVEHALGSALRELDELRKIPQDSKNKAHQVGQLAYSNEGPVADLAADERFKYKRSKLIRMPLHIRLQMKQASYARFLGHVWGMLATSLITGWILNFLFGSVPSTISFLLIGLTRTSAFVGVLIEVLLLIGGKRGDVRIFGSPEFDSDADWIELYEVQSLIGLQYRVLLGIPLAYPWFSLSTIGILIIGTLEYLQVWYFHFGQLGRLGFW